MDFMISTDLHFFALPGYESVVFGVPPVSMPLCMDAYVPRFYTVVQTSLTFSIQEFISRVQ
jgi:hypothetical protein